MTRDTNEKKLDAEEVLCLVACMVFALVMASVHEMTGFSIFTATSFIIICCSPKRNPR